MTVTLELLKRRLDEPEGSYPWVEPQDVDGFDPGLERQAAKSSWFDVGGRVDLAESAVEVIPDYLELCISQADFHGVRAVNGAGLLNAVIWLVLHLGSSYAVHTLAVWRKLVAEVSPQVAFESVLSAIDQADEPFVRDILRNLIWEFFDVGTAWPGWQRRLAGRINPKTIHALELLVVEGYETIDNTDARRFSDGTSRFPE